MATFTAQIMVGTPHPNHGGINPTHYLFLSENSRPAWVLVPQNVFEREQPNRSSKITLIPTLEHMLEDAFLMTAIFVLEDEEICRLARQFFRNKERNWVELYNDVDPEHLEVLYEKCRALPNNHKLVITAYDGSSIRSQLHVVGEYKMDVEVCVPFYSRWYSAWQNETRTSGSLEKLRERE